MTLASDIKKPIPNHSRETKPTSGQRSHSEPLPPTLLRLPNLNSTIAAADESLLGTTPEPEPTPKFVSSEVKDTACGTHVASKRATAGSGANSNTECESTVSSPVPPRPRLMERVGLHEFNVAAWVDRVATRKTLSAALVVVAAIAIWMPRSGDSTNPTAPAPASVQILDEQIEPFLISENPIDNATSTALNQAQSPVNKIASAHGSAEQPDRQSRFKPEFSDNMAKMMSVPMDPTSRESWGGGNENAGYDMDPLASAANDQIRQMDATYTDLPSVAVTDTVSFEPDDPSFSKNDDEFGGVEDLLKSRTPKPITNWADYLPSVGDEDLTKHAVTGSSSPNTSSVPSQAVAATVDSSSVRTTASPAAPDFSFGLTGGELIDADEHIAMPPMDADDRILTR